MDKKKIEINNSYEAAVKSGRWGNPGASLYNKIKDSKTLLHEAYLQVGNVDKDTSFSASGCKYPHHTVINGELVVSIPGIKAALSRARQMGVCSGELKKHLERHYREMGIYKDSALYKESVIDENFKFMDDYLGINTDAPITESADARKYDMFNDYFIPQGITTPERLLEFMSSIEYDDDDKHWKLRDPYKGNHKYGNCHDQSLFEKVWFERFEYDCGQLFFIEYNEGEEVGGRTHTLTWFIDIDTKYYWFENAWYDNRGIHGPFNSLKELKDFVHSKWEETNNTFPEDRKYDGITFFDTPNYKVGMDLEEYVDSWTGNLNEQANWIDRIVWNELFRESVFDEEKDFNSTEEQNEILNELKEFGIEDLWFVKSDDGVDNCCVKVMGYEHPMRGRSSMITLKNEGGNWYVLCKANRDDYGVPGGGWNKDEYPTDAAIRELHEETLSDVTNLSRLGVLIEYSDDINDVKQWVKDHVAEPDDWWYGYYSQIFVGMYNGKYTGKVDAEDRETGYSWKLVSDVESEFPKEYQEAIHTYLSITEDTPLNESNLTKEFRYVINEEDGHFIKVVYELNPDNATCTDRNTLRTKGDTNYVSKGNKIVALVDMCNNKRLDHVSAFPPIHNIGGNIAPITIQKYMSTIRRFEKDEAKLKKIEDELKKECPTGIAPSLEFPSAINKSKAKGQTPIEYKVGEIDNTETCKTTNPIHTMQNMFNIPPKGMRESVEDILNSEIFIEADEDTSEEEDPQDVTSRIIANVKKDEPEEETADEEPVEEPATEEEPVEEEPAEEPQEETPVEEVEEPTEDTPQEEPEETPPELPVEDVQEEDEKPKSLPKQADKEEEKKNGVNRKKLYIAFIEHAKAINKKNVFGSIFDKDAFHVTYPYVPHELRYFYRLANPTLCVMEDDFTFFAVSELKKINKDNKEFPKKLIFAAKPDLLYVFNNDNKQIYTATEGDNNLTLKDEVAKTFDLFIQDIVGKGDILNSPPDLEGAVMKDA